MQTSGQLRSASMKRPRRERYPTISESGLCSACFSEHSVGVTAVLVSGCLEYRKMLSESCLICPAFSSIQIVFHLILTFIFSAAQYLHTNHQLCQRRAQIVGHSSNHGLVVEHRRGSASRCARKARRMASSPRTRRPSSSVPFTMMGWVRSPPSNIWISSLNTQI